MQDTILYLSPKNIFHLKFFQAVHPSETHIKADHWRFIFELTTPAGANICKGYFSDNFFISEKLQIVILEEYDESILEEATFKTDADVKINLRIFDFNKNKTAKFSRLSAGKFSIKNISEEKIIYNKVYYDKTVEFEINLHDIEFKTIYDEN